MTFGPLFLGLWIKGDLGVTQSHENVNVTRFGLRLEEVRSLIRSSRLLISAAFHLLIPPSRDPHLRHQSLSAVLCAIYIQVHTDLSSLRTQGSAESWIPVQAPKFNFVPLNHFRDDLSFRVRLFWNKKKQGQRWFEVRDLSGVSTMENLDNLTPGFLWSCEQQSIWHNLGATRLHL